MTDQKKHQVPNADTHNQGEGKPGGGNPGIDEGLGDQGGNRGGGTQGDNRRRGDLDGNRGGQGGDKQGGSGNQGDGHRS